MTGFCWDPRTPGAYCPVSFVGGTIVVRFDAQWHLITAFPQPADGFRAPSR